MPITILLYLGSGPLGEARKKALETLAAEAECFWNNEPSIGRFIIQIADQKIREGRNLSMREIVQKIIENGRASTQEELESEFEFEASEQGWSDEEIRAAIESPWFPEI